MELSPGLADALASADETYLLGLSNKGTLNRGKKDLEGLADVTVTVAGTECTLRWGDTECTIRAPLGSSSCSCPSSAFCRHRVSAILWLKNRLQENPMPAKAPDFASLRSYPLEKLTSVLGPSRISAIVFRAESGQIPEIREGSVVQVELPGHSVRLLEPLEHSTCSCHSSKFCVHKAEALLWWQMHKGIVTPSQLQADTAAKALDADQIRGICRALREILASLMALGLGRTDGDVCHTIERMASLCHTAGLPDLERCLRRLKGSYDDCFARSAGFRDTDLLARLSQTFRLAEALEQAGPEDLPQLAGQFREDYRSVGNLSVYLLGSRHYSGKNGYEGTIYYFWEEQQEKFYFFRHIRPTFYEGNSKKIPRHIAPWGLSCTLDKLFHCRIALSGPKVNASGNLSATSECSASILGSAPVGAVIGGHRICRDFRQLLEQSESGRSENQQLALIQPARMEQPAYDTIRQVYRLRLLDPDGRDLWINVAYSQQEAPVIDALERLTRGFVSSSTAPVFFGRIYRDGDRLCCYPIEFFINWEECV